MKVDQENPEEYEREYTAAAFGLAMVMLINHYFNQRQVIEIVITKHFL
jgi:hypothetical protein